MVISFPRNCVQCCIPIYQTKSIVHLCDCLIAVCETCARKGIKSLDLQEYHCPSCGQKDILVNLGILSLSSHMVRKPRLDSRKDGQSISFDLLECSIGRNFAKMNYGSTIRKQKRDIKFKCVKGITQQMSQTPSRVDCLQRTKPLHFASVKGHTDIAKLLLLSGADKERKDKFDRKALDLCPTEEMRAELEETVSLMSSGSPVRRRRGRSCACCEVQEADGVGAVGGPPKFQLCSACKGVAYCSTTCQSLDWKARHKRECKVMQGLK